MYVTSAMLADKLDIDPQASLLKPDSLGRFQSIRCFPPSNNRLDKEAAYVMDDKQLSILEYINPNALIICPGKVREDPGCSLLVTRTDFEATYFAAAEAFEAFNDLENDLRDSILAGEGLDSLLAICARFFKNRVQVLDQAFNVVAGFNPVVDPISSEVLDYQQDVSTFSPSTLDEMSKNNLLLETYAFKTAQFHQSSLFRHRSIISNLFHDDQYLGKLLIIESESSLGQGAIDVANQIVPFISHLMQKRSSELDVTLHSTEHFMSEIIKGNISDAAFIAAQIASLGWQMNDWFSILAIDINASSLIDFYTQIIRQHLTGSVVFPASSGLAAVVRLNPENPAETKKHILQVLEEIHLQSGMSEPFNDFRLSSDHFIQACSAQSAAARMQSPGLHQYQDHAIDHLFLVMAQAEQHRAFIHPAIRTIVQYDEANNTEYLATLKTYLTSNFNQVLTAKRLHIHRKTLQYRLERLTQIAQVYLDDSNEQIRLALSIKFFEHEKAVNPKLFLD